MQHIVPEGLERHLRSSPEESFGPAWADGQILDAAGVPTLCLGPIGSGAHADEEWVDLQSMLVLTKTLDDVISDWCG
jgi:acetylornithine deacetylase